ncbi:MAG: ABC transporter permease [Candidatus Omnitrophica bacterium]|nr:ABC transporter permease [Candidatus Omnitrophota bacterium]
MKGASLSQRALFWRRFRRNKRGIVGAWIVLGLYLVAIFAPVLAPYNPNEQLNLAQKRFQPPSKEHPFGTDRFSRDVLSRVVYGSRISLTIGFLAVAIAITLGTIVGLCAGYYGGFTDNFLMRTVDILMIFPVLFLIITIIAVFHHQSIWLVIIVLAFTGWMGVARLVRGEVLTLKEREFIEASRALGAGALRIMFRHLLPNALTPIIVAATLRVGSTILTESALSFLGLGVQPPTASWGNIINEGQDNLLGAWWVSTFSGLAIVITVIGYNLLGDGLRDAFDPRAAQK